MIKTEKDMTEAFQELREHVEKTLKRSAYQNIKLSELFRKMMPSQHKALN